VSAKHREPSYLSGLDASVQGQGDAQHCGTLRGGTQQGNRVTEIGKVDEGQLCYFEDIEIGPTRTTSELPLSEEAIIAFARAWNPQRAKWSA
jgi:hypothetical protein